MAHHAGLYQLAAMRMMEDQNRLEARRGPIFRMELLYMLADHYRPSWCERFIFALEQPQDPKEYRPQQDIDKHLHERLENCSMATLPGQMQVDFDIF